MPSHKTVERQMRRSERRREINAKNLSRLRTQIKKMRGAIKDKDAEAAKELLPKTFSTIDKVVTKGTIHKKTGDRYKSRLSKQSDFISASPSK
jgi:small subunit ribosomal protein S20